jgi:hypothetical protein
MGTDFARKHMSRVVRYDCGAYAVRGCLGLRCISESTQSLVTPTR